MASAEARLDALREAWTEARAAGGGTGPIDVAIEAAVRDYRRAEGKYRKAAKREAKA